MPLVTGGALLQQAQVGRYAVGAFNCHTLDMIPAVVAAATEVSAPVILQFTMGSIQAAGWAEVGALARTVAQGAPVPVAIHLDHGPSYAAALQAIRYGFTSVMIDGSALPYAANVALTQKVVEAGQAAGVTVEAEIGHVGGVEDGQGSEHGWLTDPEDAARFWKECRMDYLATAFGTAHGLYKEKPKLDLDRVAAIAARVEIPLVMHGGSDTPDDQVVAVIARGICKVNVATELKEAWASALRESLAAMPHESDPRKILLAPRTAVQAIVRQKLQLFGAAGKA
jgi:fructose-bisphosphate aldolase class II